MAERKPLVLLDNNLISELPAGDTLPGGGGGMVYRKQATFTTSQSWTFPVTALPSINYDIIGGGGAGKGCDNSNGNKSSGGGGGGERKRGIMSLVPGDTYSVVVGSGGVGTASVADGGNGGNSAFAGIIARGGDGGAASGTVAIGGAAGSGAPPVALALYSAESAGGSSSASLPGGIGFDGMCSGGGCGHNNAASRGGPGAGSGALNADGGDATGIGCGGGGAGRPTGTLVALKGGDGFRGQVTVTYWDTVL